jgi:general secretion pathway protein F
MGAFEFAALDKSGKEKKGVLSVDEVAQKEIRAGEKKGFSLSIRRGISATDLALITRQLATLVHSGLPLDEATSTVARQCEKPRLRSLMLGVRARVMEGHSLADGLGKFPHVFPELYRATVAAGEQSGHLDTILERLADYTEARQQMTQRVQMAMFYPAILTFMAIAVVAVLLGYVVPQVVEVFEDMGQTLPLMTRILIAVSGGFRDYGLYGFIVLALIATAIAYVLKKPGPKYKFHGFLLRLPLLGRFTRGVNTSRFARTLSILAASGVPVLEALRIAGEVVSNLPMREAVKMAAIKVREGAPLARSLEQSGYFPPMTVNLIGSGEVSGNLEEMLERAATNQEREQETQISFLMSMLEPVLIIVMGMVVLFIVLATLLPIFNMNQLIS